MKYRIIIIIIIMIILGGLDNYIELNSLAIVSSVGIDKEDNMYTVSVQIMNSKKESSGSTTTPSSNITVYQSKAETVQKAIRQMIKESPKKLYGSHMEVLVINEEVAKEGLRKSIDFFLRDVNSNKEMNVIIAKDKASDVLKILTPIETNPTKNLKNSIMATFNYQGDTTKGVFDHAISDFIEYGINITLPSAYIEGEVEKGEDKENLEKPMQEATVKVGNIAYFEKDELKGYLKEDDNMCLNVFKNNIENAIIEAKIDENKIVVEIVNLKNSLKPEIVNGEFKVNLDLDIDVNIAETQSDLNVITEEEVKELEEKIADIIKNKLYKFVDNTKYEYKNDIIGIGKMFNKYLNKDFKKYKEDFEEKYFEKVEYNINVNVNLDKEGGIVKKW